MSTVSRRSLYCIVLYLFAHKPKYAQLKYKIEKMQWVAGARNIQVIITKTLTHVLKSSTHIRVSAIYLINLRNLIIHLPLLVNGNWAKCLVLYFVRINLSIIMFLIFTICVYSCNVDLIVFILVLYFVKCNLSVASECP